MRWHFIGNLDVASHLWAGDAIFEMHERSGVHVSVPPGRYRIDVALSPTEPAYVLAARAYLEGSTFQIGPSIGSVSIDVARAGIADFERLTTDWGFPDRDTENKHLWEVVPAVDLADIVGLSADGRSLRMAVVTTNDGDGTYEGFALLSASTVVGLLLDFTRDISGSRD